MAFANSEWRELHDQALVFVEAAIGSGHNPLILNTKSPLSKVGKPFKFESFQVMDDECKGVISGSWQQDGIDSRMFAFYKNIRECKVNLKEWSHNKFGNIRLRINTVKDQILDTQINLGKGFNPDLVARGKTLLLELENLWQKDSMYWHQRSRIKWLQLGDRNSWLFHLSTIQRRQRNQIARLKDFVGEWRSEPREISKVIEDHFQKLYEAPPKREFEDLINLIDPLVSIECNANLTKQVTLEEVQAVAFQMGPLKAPGSDGFPGIFYQSYWDIVGEDVFKAVRQFFSEGTLLREMNQTNITLIHKVPNPEAMTQFWPISLIDSSTKSSPKSQLIDFNPSWMTSSQNNNQLLFLDDKFRLTSSLPMRCSTPSSIKRQGPKLPWLSRWASIRLLIGFLGLLV